MISRLRKANAIYTLIYLCASISCFYEYLCLHSVCIYICTYMFDINNAYMYIYIYIYISCVCVYIYTYINYTYICIYVCIFFCL